MLENKEQQKVPNVTFTLRANDEWTTRNSDEIFSNKTVVVFHYRVHLRQHVHHHTYHATMN